MRFTVVTIFPEMFASVLSAGVLGRAISAGKLAVEFVNPRDFTGDRHRTVDDTPYGGGPGMVMKVEPLIAAIESVATPAHRVLLSPQGAPLDQARVRALSGLDHIVLVCGRYEGIDERVRELAIDTQLSLGDFVLTGGELAAMAVIDAVSRHVPGVLGEAASADDESFSEHLLEYPQYTRPMTFRQNSVPDILVSGHHARIADWRRTQSLRRTALHRPDVLARHRMTERDRGLWSACADVDLARRTYVALVHYPVYDRDRNIVTSAVTNFDIHDIARSTTTYGLAGYVMVTPVKAQRDKVDRILAVWKSGGQGGADNRIDALSRVATASSIEGAIREITDRHGARPVIVATSARDGRECVGFADFRRAAIADVGRPVLLLFGTAWGLSDSVIDDADQLLMPISGHPEFNHLSVRSAVCAILDRVFGLREG